MNYGKLFGFGALIWVIAFAAASLFLFLGLSGNIYANIAVVIIVAASAYLLGLTLKVDTIRQALIYSITWMVISMLLDLVITVQFSGWSLFSQWDVWAGYAAILILPLFAAR